MIKINKPKECCGCTACQSICNKNAIRMVADQEGFLYPFVDDKVCNNCGLCETVCPLLLRKNVQRLRTYKKIYALRNKNHSVLMNSSSGGAFGAIAEYVLSKGGCVVGAVYSSKMEVVHTFAYSIEDYEKMRGSKYSQSNIQGVYRKCKEYLLSNTSKILLFTGTPCQVHGLKTFLRKDYDNLITVDLVCHAVASPKVFLDYVEMVNRKFNDKLVDLNMRYKQSGGWSHHFAYHYTFASGKHSVNPDGLYDWGRVYFSNLANRPSCETCPYTNYNREGDFTLADFWDDEKNRPDIYSKDGTSLFIVNSEKGGLLFEQFKDNVNIWEISEKEATQPCLKEPTASHIERKYFWRYYSQKGLEKAIKHYCVPSFFDRVRRKIRKILGLIP